MRPAVEGTRNVVSSINKSASVKKVVLTSSTLAIVANPFDNPDGVQHLYTRDDLCKIDDPDQEAYILAKREQLLLMEKLCAEQVRPSWFSHHTQGHSHPVTHTQTPSLTPRHSRPVTHTPSLTPRH